jgi:hypothetical protein
MNLRDLMTKLDTIAEADDARAQYDKFKADDARTGAVAQVKKMLAPNGNSNFIDPKDGVVKYQDQSRGDGGAGGIKEFPYKWFASGQEKAFFDLLKTAGLEIVPVDKKQLFGTFQVAGIKGGPQALTDLDKPVTPNPVANPVANPGQDPTDAQMIELDKLRDQLLATLGGGAPAPVTTTNPVTAPVDQPEKEKTLGQKVGIGAGVAGGAAAGAALGKKFGGSKGAVLGGLTGGALGGMGVNAFQKEGVEFNSSIAQSLTESFGYDYQEQLDEYSMDQFKTDAGDTLRGAANGATLGTYDNIAAGVQSAFGKDTYKQALAQQTAASKEAEKRNPLLYTAGNVAGSFAAPIPGGAIAAGVGRLGGGMLAKGAAQLGANMLAQKGVDVVKQASDTKTLGYDPSKYPKTPQEVMAFQKANGLAADGKIGPKTQAVLAKMGLTPATVAEDIKSLKEKLSMIASGGQDYRVWLLENNTVVDDHGNQITDQSMLDAIEWDQARLDELSLGGMGNVLGRGVDAVANVGRNFVGGLKGQNATGNLIKGTEKNFAGRMAAPKANGNVRSAAEIARDSTNARGTANMANKAANYVGKNPGKVALGAAALGAGGIAAANALGSSASPAGTTTGGGGIPAGTTTGGGGPMQPMPAGGGELTPEQKEIIAKMQKIIQGVGATEDEGLLGHIAPANDAIQKATQTTGQAKTVSAEKRTPAEIQASADLKGMDGVQESSDELSRWLRIARG